MKLRDAELWIAKHTPEITREVGHKKWAVCGSIRRKKAEVGDIDIVSLEPDKRRMKKGIFSNLMKFQIWYGQDMHDVLALILHKTGSAEFNIEMASKAKKKNLFLNAYGLHERIDNRPGKRILYNEREIVQFLQGYWIPPEARGGWTR